MDVAAKTARGSYYTSIGRNKYSRALLEKAQSFSEQSISQQQAYDGMDGSPPGNRLGTSPTIPCDELW